MIKPSSSLLIALLLCVSTLTYAGSCSREDIVFYLKQGFTHDQVTKICHTPEGKSPQINHLIPQSAQQSTTAANGNQHSTDMMIFLKSSIESDELQLTRSQMTLTKHHHCIKYGVEDGAGFRNKVCVRIQTTIQLPGLKVLKARKSIPLIGKPELVIEGDIKHQILNLSILSSKQRRELLDDFDQNPSRFELALRSGVNPKLVELKLSTLIR